MHANKIGWKNVTEKSIIQQSTMRIYLYLGILFPVVKLVIDVIRSLKKVLRQCNKSKINKQRFKIGKINGTVWWHIGY
ncbi:hypothetical protein BH11BAC6_BH11BAC6_11490 [soil metagenome]